MKFDGIKRFAIEHPFLTVSAIGTIVGGVKSIVGYITDCVNYQAYAKACAAVGQEPIQKGYRRTINNNDSDWTDGTMTDAPVTNKTADTMAKKITTAVTDHVADKAFDAITNEDDIQKGDH